MQEKKKKNSLNFFKIDNTVVTGITSIANKFNFFFTNIESNLAKEICVPSRNNFKNYLLNQDDNNFTFKLIGEDFVSKLIDDLDSKNSTGCDGLSNTLLKSIKLNLVKPITLIVNQMLTTGIFPDKLKIAKVIPLFKRGDKSIFSNYRPISLLPSISKLFEKVIYQQLYKYFEKNEMNRASGHLCAHRLNWARRTSWGWWDDWDDTVLQTQDSKFEPWRSEAEHATSLSRRLPTILTTNILKIQIYSTRVNMVFGRVIPRNWPP